MKARISSSRLFGIALVIAALGASTPAFGHPATERFIPIGQSPGVSNKLTVVGTVQRVDPAARSITVVGSSGAVTVRIQDKTRIWLDRTKLKKTNLDASFADLALGRTVEVRFVDPGRKQIADWVKVEAPAGP